MHLLKDSGQPREFASWWDDLITAILSLWFFGGLMTDVWAHSTGQPESFFTWWHLLFYTGYAATAAWIAYLLVRGHRAGGRTGMAAIPIGYGPAVIAIPGFIVFGLLDMLWHVTLGVETGLDILFSPSHLGLAVTGITIVLAPWLSLWRRRAEGGPDHPLPQPLPFLPAALGLGSALSGVVLFLDYSIVFHHYPEQVAAGLREPYGFAGTTAVGSIMFTTLLVLGVVVLATGHFRLPIGFFSVVFIMPALMINATTGFENTAYALLFWLSGVLADCLTWLVRPDLRRRRDLITFAAGWSIIVWGAFMIVTRAEAGVWPVAEISIGAPIVAALVGTLFVLVIQPVRREVDPPQAPAPSPFDEVMARAKAMASNRGEGGEPSA